MNNYNKTTEEMNILELEIIETCKQFNHDLFVESSRLTTEINMLYNKNYKVEDINLVLGYLFEKQYNQTVNSITYVNDN